MLLTAPPQLPSSLEDSIPLDKREAVLRAIRVAFENSTVAAASRVAGGASGATILRIAVNAEDFLVRIERASNALHDPARQYACMRIAADAGLAPRLVYADPVDGVCITDFIQVSSPPVAMSRAARLQAIVETVKALHATPLFPHSMHYLQCIEVLIGEVCSTGILPEEAIQEYFRPYRELASAYPDDDRVSSHNDINPSNVLFAAERPWIVDWEAAFATDRYVDIAAVANFFAGDPAEEDLVLRTYFGPGLTEYHRARFFLMQQVNRMFYAMALLRSVAAAQHGTQLTAAYLNTPRFSQLRGEMASLATHEGRKRFGFAFLNEMLFHLHSPRFAQAISLVTAPR